MARVGGAAHGRSGWFRVLLGCAPLLVACGATVDPLGTLPEGPAPTPEPAPMPEPAPTPDPGTLHELSGPSSYPNAFADLLGKSDAEIADKLNASFDHLFHGDPTSEAIYFTVGDDQAYIQDIFHGDVRTEGMGLGMLAALELDRREEFDRLWRFSAASLRSASGPSRGYLRSSCGGHTCADPFGQQMIATALLFAHGRWGSTSGDIDYAAEFLALLSVMRDKEQENGGVVEDVTNMFDAETKLPVDEPSSERAGRTRPSNVMPAWYELWAQATGDASWSAAAEAGRQLLQSAAHPTSGLLPLRAEFDGTPVAGSSAYVPECYRTQISFTLDHVFFEPMSWYPDESDTLLRFFSSEGLDEYCSSYELDGSSCLNNGRSNALIAINGVSALPSTRSDRTDFVQAVWDLKPPSGVFRYYDGLLHLVALLALSGELRVY